jgi:hypothetical protein
MATKTIKKVEYYALIRDILASIENSESMDTILDCVNFLEKQITIENSRNEKRAAKVNEKRDAANAEMYEAILSVLTSEYQDGNTVASFVGEKLGRELTILNVRPKINQLVGKGMVVKETIKTEDGHQRTVYKLA